MPKTIQSKLVDSRVDLQNGGRAQRWWAGKSPKNSTKYQVDSSLQVVDQLAVIKKYKLKGFEYGNWVNNNDRNDRLSATSESLYDLAKIIGTDNIGFDGMLGIAFGARGIPGALAHFEPSTYMINLTREKGFGSLAHEYGHAIDYFFGTYIDQSRDYASLVGGRTTTQLLEFPNSGDYRKLANKIINSVVFDKKGKKSKTYEAWEQNFKAGGYWFRRNEIFARTFEQWVRAKLKAKGIKNTFLSKEKYEHVAYIKPADFARVEPMMDKLIKAFGQVLSGKVNPGKSHIEMPGKKPKAATRK